ncbi:MAG TPA: Hsp70 family protein [Spirochaetota bacterium]|nr:Hsp70 family protein [Spirochaetota bacterium]
MKHIIGIDLGTTNSSVAYFHNGKPEIIKDKDGFSLTPSIVSFCKNSKKVLVGRDAKKEIISNPERTFVNIKRDMGSNKNLIIDEEIYPVQFVASFILSKLKKDAEDFLKEKITDAVITVPAYWTDAQRSATIEAGKIAGLNVVRIINEPTAACLAYGLDKEDSGIFVVYDFGGGTFDVSVLEYENGVFEVKATKGNNKLGGIDFDNMLVDFIIEKYKEQEKIDLSSDKLAIQKLREEAENIKIKLSKIDFVEVNIPAITATKNGVKDLNFEITIDIFETLIEDYINETIRLTKLAIEEANLKIEDVSKIILVGGSSKIRLVRKKIEEIFGNKICSGIEPFEVVALGASIQAAIIAKEIDNVALVDITPLSLGIEVGEGLFVPIIERNTKIPVEATKIFTTLYDNQTEVEIHVLQGERPLAKENVSLGKFILSGIKKGKKGEARIEVKFEIDVNSIVKVSARDCDTLEEKSITINSNIGLSQKDLEKIIRTAKKHREDDEEIVRITKIKRATREIIFNIKEIISNTLIEDKFKKEIEKSIDNFNNAIENRDILLAEKYKEILENFYEELLVNFNSNYSDSFISIGEGNVC